MNSIDESLDVIYGCIAEPSECVAECLDGSPCCVGLSPNCREDPFNPVGWVDCGDGYLWCGEHNYED